MNPNYEIIEQIFKLDIAASLVTQDSRAAQKELIELEKRSKLSEELLNKSRAEMNFHESEIRRLYKRLDELENKKNEKSNRLFTAKNDDDHRIFKRELDNVDKEFRETNRKIDELESKLEHSKSLLNKAQTDLQTTVTASEGERNKAQSSKESSSGRLEEIQKVRDSYLPKLDDRIIQHYQRVSRITRNPNGPICRISEGACGNCRIGLSPQILNNITLGKSIEFCPNCSHILLPTESSI